MVTGRVRRAAVYWRARLAAWPDTQLWGIWLLAAILLAVVLWRCL